MQAAPGAYKVSKGSGCSLPDLFNVGTQLLLYYCVGLIMCVGTALLSSAQYAQLWLCCWLGDEQSVTRDIGYFEYVALFYICGTLHTCHTCVDLWCICMIMPCCDLQLCVL